MPSTATTEYEPSVSDRLVYKRDAREVIVEITMPQCLMFPIPGGNCAAQGTHNYRMQAHEVKQLDRWVRSEEDKQAYTQAQAQYQRDFEKHVRDVLDGGASDGMTESQRAALREQIVAEWPGSVEGVLNRMFERSMPPFESYKIVESDLLNPADEERLLNGQDNAVAIARAVATALKAMK